jgi:hypothetical protein
MPTMKYLVLASIAVAASLSLSPALAGPSHSTLDARACMKNHGVSKVQRSSRAAPRWQAVEVCDGMVLARPYVLALYGLPAFPKPTDWFMR